MEFEDTMNDNWPLVPLGKILTKSEETTEIELTKTYRRVTVRLWGRGAVLRDEVDGAQISAKKQSVIHPQQFLISRIDARHGASAIVPGFLDGAIVSNDFPTFHLNHARILPDFLGWLSKTITFVELCKTASEGTTNRVRLKLDRFLATEIPLPPLDEQRRIVAHIEELAAKVEQTQELRRQSVAEVSALWESSLTSIFNRLEKTHTAKTFQEFCEVVRGGSPRPAGDPLYYDGPIPFLKVADLTKDDSMHVKSYTFSIKEAGLRKTRVVEANTLMLTNSGATLGVPKICTFETTFNDGIQAFLKLPDDIAKEYLYYFLRSKTRWFRELLARGQGQPNLNTNMLKTTTVPLPCLSEQHRIVAYLDRLQAKVEAVKRHQAATAARLDALLPSILDGAFKGEL